MAHLEDTLDHEGSFEYTFTNTELEDVLGFLERRQSGVSMEEEQADMPLFGASLQFQPRPISLSSEFDIDINALVESQQPQYPNKPIPMGTAFIPTTDAMMTRPVHNTPPKNTTNTNNSSVKLKETPKHTGVSHSSVEKQRRDRINALIDELRDLVPPRSLPTEGGLLHSDDRPNMHALSIGGDLAVSRRPKHAVLSDTIALVKDLQNKLSMNTAAINDTHQEMNRMNRSYDDDANTNIKEEEEEIKEKSKLAADFLPSTSIAPEKEGVEIDPGEDCLFVKVHCKDRHGLLSDLVRTLKAIPSEIKTASITTLPTGNVYDIFQVVLLSNSGGHNSSNVGGSRNNNDTPAEDNNYNIEMIKSSVEAAALNGIVVPVAAEKRRRRAVDTHD